MSSSQVIDYEFKSKVLNENHDLIVRQRKASYKSYCESVLVEDGVVLHGLKDSSYNESVNDLMAYCIENGLHREYNEARKINDAFYSRVKRLKQKVEAILLEGDSVFLTLTFTDTTLQETTPKQRRVAVSRFLKQYNAKYVANIDFGKDNHREHYHALIAVKSVKRDTWSKYGAINFQRVRLRDINSDKVKLSKYISKLSNHAIKETTRRSALMYSRD